MRKIAALTAAALGFCLLGAGTAYAIPGSDFYTCDKNHDGVVDKTEVKACIKNVTEQEFSQADLNSNGTLGPGEYALLRFGDEGSSASKS